jgi:hypothetical protein
MSEATYEGYLETLVALVVADRAQVADAEEARTGLGDAREARVRVARQTETLHALVRRQLARAELPDLTPPPPSLPAAGAQLAAPRPAPVELDAASQLAAKLSALVDTLLANRAEAEAKAEWEAAERERRKARIRRLALLVLAIAVMAVAVVLLD